MKTTDPPIIVESTLAGTLQQAWEAITVHDKMIEWYFQNIPDFQARVGFHTEFPVQSGARTFTHIWDVTEVIPQQKISYHWTYTEYPGESKVSFELLPEGDAIKLRLTNIVLRDFPQDVPEFKRESCIAGWRYFIQQQLTEYILKDA
jgi:uncharacterized protein YndB with AHSA1/START domain